MSSPALDDFNAFVDSLAISAARKTALKVKGEDFYVRVVKEYTRHLRKHIAAAKLSGGDAALCDQLDAIATSQEAEADHIVVAYAKAL